MRHETPASFVAARATPADYAALFSMGADDPPPARPRVSKPSLRERLEAFGRRLAFALFEQVPCEDMDMRPLPPRYARSSLQT